MTFLICLYKKYSNGISSIFIVLKDFLLLTGRTLLENEIPQILLDEIQFLSPRASAMGAYSGISEKIAHSQCRSKAVA